MHFVDPFPFLRYSAISSAVLLGTGCGLLRLPAEADQAVIDWKEHVAETDICRADAMQHCVGASITADACGSPCAMTLGLLLEISQRDGDPMDFANNRSGAFCGQPLAGFDDGAIACCETLLNETPSALRTDGNCR